tara:strand:+ start:41206 stop:41472 length:267 start_codon:yes stop_codon:yes gene_type:complete
LFRSLIDSKARAVNIVLQEACRFMDDDENLPRSANDPLALAVKEDLDPLSVAELDQRISLLKSEISRCEAKKNFAVTHRASAENLFKR